MVFRRHKKYELRSTQLAVVYEKDTGAVSSCSTCDLFPLQFSRFENTHTHLHHGVVYVEDRKLSDETQLSLPSVGSNTMRKIYLMLLRYAYAMNGSQ